MSTARRLLLLGGVEAAALAALAWWPGPAMPVPGVPLFLGAFGAYAAAAYASSGNEGATGPNVSAFTVIWGGALLFRLVLLPAAPELSDDVFRYLWDGHVQLQGVNPYRYAPADPALADIRTPWHDRINHPEVGTIYPPVAQVAFLVLALLGGGILQAKLLWVGLDLAAGWILFRVARKTGRHPARVLTLYLWSPLLVVETAWSAHLEPLGLVSMAALLAFAVGALGGGPADGHGEVPEADGSEADDGRDLDSGHPLPGRAGMAAAAATLTKFAPAATLPPLLRRLGLRLGIAFVATSLVAYLPYLGAGSGLWEGLFTYVRDWRFMVGPFSLLESVLPGRWAPRLAAGAVVAGVVAWATWRRFTAERSLFWILGTGLLLSPTVHPWYVLWILPFAALRGDGPWILLSGLVFLGYWGLGTFQDTGSWPQPVWLRLLVWVPPLAWLAAREVRRLIPDHPREPLQGEAQVSGSEQK